MEAGEIWQILGLSRRAGQPATRAGEHLRYVLGFLVLAALAGCGRAPLPPPTQVFAGDPDLGVGTPASDTLSGQAFLDATVSMQGFVEAGPGTHYEHGAPIEMGVGGIVCQRGSVHPHHSLPSDGSRPARERLHFVVPLRHEDGLPDLLYQLKS